MSDATSQPRPLRVLLSAGEASGEMHAAALLQELSRLAPEGGWAGVESFGVGGEALRAAGCRIVVEAREIAVVGLFEVVRHLPGLWRRFRSLLAEARRVRPDVAVLVDFPDWNLRLARELRRMGVPVVYYVSPQLWAWRQGRVRQVRRDVTKMLTIFPFEVDFYKRHGVEAEFVGHPLAGLKPPELDDSGWIGLLPGSRRREILHNLPPILQTSASFADRWRLQMPVASTIDEEWLRGECRRLAPGLSIEFTRDARRTLAGARASLVASGTATLEAALMGCPFLIVYRLSALTYAVGKRLVRTPFYGMANLIIGREAAPELIQHECTAERLRPLLAELLDDSPRRARMIEDLAEVRRALASGHCEPAAVNAARAVLRAAGRGAQRAQDI